MQIRIMKVAILPAILLVMIGVARWQIWKRDNPPVTDADLKLRSILQKSNMISFTTKNYSNVKKFSPTQKRTLIDHLWVTSAPLTANYPRPSGQTLQIQFDLLSLEFGSITLFPDAAFSRVNIQHWDHDRVFHGSPPTMTSEEDFDLHPASNRFLRAWLSAGAP